MKKLTKTKLSELTDWNQSTFFFWLKKQKTPEKVYRYDALMLGATLMENGYTMGVLTQMIDNYQEQQEENMRLKEKNEILCAELVELENAIHQYADKMEAIKGTFDERRS